MNKVQGIVKKVFVNEKPIKTKFGNTHPFNVLLDNDERYSHFVKDPATLPVKVGDKVEILFTTEENVVGDKVYKNNKIQGAKGLLILEAGKSVDSKPIKMVGKDVGIRVGHAINNAVLLLIEEKKKGITREDIIEKAKLIMNVHDHLTESEG